MCTNTAGGPAGSGDEVDQHLAFDLIRSYRDYYGTYHHHKERMAFSGAALYLAAAGALAFRDEPVWGNCLGQCLLLIIVIISAIIGFTFVAWQFRNREAGADMVAACTNLAARWLYSRPKRDDDLQPKSHVGFQWPAALVAELESIKTKRKCLEGPRKSEFLTYLIMALFTAMVIMRALLQVSSSYGTGG